jgi:hypothetical protein
MFMCDWSEFFNRKTYMIAASFLTGSTTLRRETIQHSGEAIGHSGERFVAIRGIQASLSAASQRNDRRIPSVIYVQTVNKKQQQAVVGIFEKGA